LIERVRNIGKRRNGKVIAFRINLGLRDLVLTRPFRFDVLLNSGEV